MYSTDPKWLQHPHQQVPNNCAKWKWSCTCTPKIRSRHTNAAVQMTALKDVNANKTPHCLEHDVLEHITASVTSLKIPHLIGTEDDMQLLLQSPTVGPTSFLLYVKNLLQSTLSLHNCSPLVMIYMILQLSLNVTVISLLSCFKSFRNSNLKEYLL